MIKSITKHVKAINVLLLVVIIAVTAFVTKYTFEKILNVFSEQIYADVVEQKLNFMGDTANKIMTDLNMMKEMQSDYFMNLADSYEEQVKDVAERSEELGTDGVEGELKKILLSGPYSQYMSLMLYDSDTYEVYEDTNGLLGDSWNGNTKSLEGSFLSLNKVEANNITILYGVRNTALDEYVKATIANNVRHYEFSNDGLGIRIREIRNYEGGKNFSKYVVDTENSSNEGHLISTDDTDKGGYVFYKEELRQLNDRGEAKYLTDEVDEAGESYKRLNYSKLYKDYDWVIVISAKLTDIDRYVINSEEKVRPVIMRYRLILAGACVVLLLFVIMVIFHGEKKYFLSRQKKLQHQVDRDELTHAFSRAFGVEKFEQLFDNFRAGGQSPAFMILDVDYFKQINDTYGHEAGDVVLRRVVTALNHVVRSTDYIVRWGGDEFIGIFPGLSRENCRKFANKVVEVVRDIEVVFEDQTITITVSIGFAYFEPVDRDYTDGLKRADEALYKSKQNGRNQANIAPRGNSGAADESMPFEN